MWRQALDSEARHLAVGGKGSELGVWDIHTQQRVFLGKGAKPNRIGLVDPAQNSAVAYMPGADSSRVRGVHIVQRMAAGLDEELMGIAHAQVLVGTAKHRLRLYDVRAHRRPALDLEFGASRITSLAVEPEGDCLFCKVCCAHCRWFTAKLSMGCSLSRAPAGVTGLRAWAADASGNIGVLDLRAARLSGSLKGLTGGSRGLACHEAKPLLAVVSLDRFLRFYDTQVRMHVCLACRGS